jgi:hypothetical protein
MLISVFELLADARDQVSAVTAAIDAQQQFWLADAALQASVIGRPTNTTCQSRPARPARRCRPLKQRHAMTSRRDFFKFAGIAGGAVAAGRSAVWPWRPCPSRSSRPARTPWRRWCPTRGGPTTRWSRSTAGRCRGA